MVITPAVASRVCFPLQFVGPEDLLCGHQQLRRLDWIRLLRSGLALVLDLEFSFCVIIYYHNLFVSWSWSGKGQLLVWEWQSESYVFKQQGHFNSMASLAFSPDGQYIVTGGDDGKVSHMSNVR